MRRFGPGGRDQTIWGRGGAVGQWGVGLGVGLGLWSISGRPRGLLSGTGQLRGLPQRLEAGRRDHTRAGLE